MNEEIDQVGAQRKLLELARSTIASRLFEEKEISTGPDEPYLEKTAATFVTLKIDGKLRGCIGSLEATTSLWQSVKQNAISAAFHDYRFKPLSAEELEKVHIDISILTEPVPLDYRDAEDLVTLLRPGFDGVIVQQGHRGATFLPQVWEQLPTPEQFLTQLCRKAGLAGNCWQYEHPDIQIYQVQSFAEDE